MTDDKSKAMLGPEIINKKQPLLQYISRIFIVIGMLSFLTTFAADFFRNRDFPAEYKLTAPLPIAGMSWLTEHDEKLYVYVDNQGGVNVFDLDGNFKYALVIDYSSNGLGSMIHDGNSLIMVSRDNRYYYIEGDTLIPSTSFADKLADAELCYEKTYDDEKYRITLLGALKVNGEITHRTNFFKWYINSPFVCWAVAAFGILLGSFDYYKNKRKKQGD